MKKLFVLLVIRVDYPCEIPSSKGEEISRPDDISAKAAIQPIQENSFTLPRTFQQLSKKFLFQDLWHLSSLLSSQAPPQPPIGQEFWSSLVSVITQVVIEVQEGRK